MSRVKSIFAVLLLTAMAGLVPAQAQTLKTVIAGSSGLWQALAVGAYNGGTSIVAGGGATFHWTSASNAVNLTDTRPTPVNNDPGTLWVVWDSAATPNVWAYLKVDSVVGVRCYFAQPHCNENATAAVLSAAGAAQIAAAIWGADSPLPASIQSLFTAGVLVNVAATDIRPEDAAFAECRVNSVLGASVAGGGLSDGLDGLGYNANNPSGQCPAYPIGTSGKGVGNPILSGYPASTGAANVLAFNVSGKDPFTNTTIPAFTTYPVGASPIIFVFERDKGQLTNLKSATERQLQAAFSGANCDASAFGLPAGAINVFLREPLSGTMNTTEATVFRYPTAYPTAGPGGASQETGVGANNPLKQLACTAGGKRTRAIGSGEEVKSVLNSGLNYGTDGIGYTFFSYGNVSTIANNANYGYVALNGVDPIFAAYGAGNSIDPGQPAGAGVLPAAANTPCGGFPCAEAQIWGNGFSFPNLRNGTYRSWSVLRLISTGTAGTNAKALATAAQKGVVNLVPDYVPAAPVAGTTDLGLKLLRSHYQQRDGNSVKLGVAPVNTGADKGGDMGGMIIPTTIGVTTSKQTQLIQSSTSDGLLSPVLRP